MKKGPLLLFVVLSLSAIQHLQAQVYYGGVYGGYYPPHPPRHRPAPQYSNLPKFEPTVNIAVGYGFPNLDKMQLPIYLYGYYNGTATQNGPITGSIDYQFSRFMSIGALVTHGKVTMPYYDNSGSYNPAITGSLENWSFMLNLVRYFPVNSTKVSPYLRTAIGVNSWQQNFTDNNGNKVNVGFQPQDFAYQLGLGAKFNLTKNAGFFLEAGYGKYILHGGIALKF